MKFLQFLLFLFIISLIPGQLTRFELGSPSITFYLHDFILILLIVSSVIYFFAVKKRFFLPKGAIFALVFVLIAAISQFNSMRFFPFSQVATGSLFLVRFVAFFALYLIFVNLISKNQLKFWANLLISTGIVLAILGFFQLIFFYDLTFLQAKGYDPHIGRLVSTFLDPNFLGGFQILIFNLALASFLEAKDKKLLVIVMVLFVSIILTFSRSSYLALFVSLFLFGILKSRQLAIAVFLSFVLFTPVVPRILERIFGAVTFDVTAQARIASWLQALQIFSTSPVLGVGFNNLRFAKANLGLFEISQGLGGHSGAGVDSSFLQVLATTGILGTIVFVVFYFFFIYKNFLARRNYYALAVGISMFSLLVHSQFVNSLFFPWIAACFWIKIAISDVATNSSL